MPASLTVTYSSKAKHSRAARGDTLKNKLTDVVGKAPTSASYANGQRVVVFTFRAKDDAKVPRIRACKVLRDAGHAFETHVESYSNRASA